jgi:7,8-dihydropterin-6-yl-methyl-4-(beta-D-ribofuranosyl)aminobenzene 5'-phosphate synthase
LLKITVLVENKRSRHAVQGMQPRAGLSILLNDGVSRILFDTGPDDTFIHNARLMNKSLSNLSAVVLSHGHYDHCGGVRWLEHGTRIVCHPDIAQQRYACVRLPWRTVPLKKLSVTQNYTDFDMAYYREPCALSERFFWSGEIPVSRSVAYGVTDIATSEPDYVQDEGVLIWRSQQGLVIIIGCGHRGLENIVRHCIKITGEKRIHAIIGGLHLRTATPQKLIKARELLSELKPDVLMSCHCTGVWGRFWIGDKCRLSCGDEIFIS